MRRSLSRSLSWISVSVGSGGSFGVLTIFFDVLMFTLLPEALFEDFVFKTFM